MNKKLSTIISLFTFSTLSTSVAQAQITIQPIGTFDDAPSAAGTIVNILLFVGAVACFAYIVYGGFKYVTSGDSSDNTAAARRTILNAVIGLFVLAASFVIWQIVLRATGLSGIFGM